MNSFPVRIVLMKKYLHLCLSGLNMKNNISLAADWIDQFKIQALYLMLMQQSGSTSV